MLFCFMLKKSKRMDSADAVLTHVREIQKNGLLSCCFDSCQRNPNEWIALMLFCFMLKKSKRMDFADAVLTHVREIQKNGFM
jgi:hypothetical protein